MDFLIPMLRRTKTGLPTWALAFLLQGFLVGNALGQINAGGDEVNSGLGFDQQGAPLDKSQNSGLQASRAGVPLPCPGRGLNPASSSGVPSGSSQGGLFGFGNFCLPGASIPNGPNSAAGPSGAPSASSRQQAGTAAPEGKSGQQADSSFPASVSIERSASSLNDFSPPAIAGNSSNGGSSLSGGMGLGPENITTSTGFGGTGAAGTAASGPAASVGGVGR